MNAKDYEAEWKWLNSSEAKQRSDAAKAQQFVGCNHIAGKTTYS